MRVCIQFLDIITSIKMFVNFYLQHKILMLKKTIHINVYYKQKITNRKWHNETYN